MNLFKKTKSRWKKICVYAGKMDTDDFNQQAFQAVRAFRGTLISVTDHLYFARYTGSVGCHFEITVETNLSGAAIKAYFQKCNEIDVQRVEVTPLDNGSLAHAKAYELALQLQGQGDDKMHDVLHWLCNMTGYNYLEEAHLMAVQAAQITSILLNK